MHAPSSRPIARHLIHIQLMKLAQTVLGEKLFTLVMKYTFYGHFVAGEDQVKIVPTLERYTSFRSCRPYWWICFSFLFCFFFASFSFIFYLVRVIFSVYNLPICAGGAHHAMQLMKLTKAIVGEKLFVELMRSTFYGHFVAGEDRFRIVPTLERFLCPLMWEDMSGGREHASVACKPSWFCPFCPFSIKHTLFSPCLNCVWTLKYILRIKYDALYLSELDMNYFLSKCSSIRLLNFIRKRN